MTLGFEFNIYISIWYSWRYQDMLCHWIRRLCDSVTA